MTVYSPLFALVCLAVLIGFVSLPVFKAADEPATAHGRRVATLDGLRGLLALAVFFHHAVINYAFQKTGVWTVPPSSFFTMLGQAGVALFFMITGYLFWTKLLNERGRPRWTQLFLGRVFRIGPLYLLFAASMVVLVFARSGWTIEGTVFGFLKSLAWWLPLGALGTGPDLNHQLNSSISIAGATWSLQYEWAFYASLLPLALFARHELLSCGACIVSGVVTLVLVASSVTPSLVASPIVCTAMFLAGMIVAALQKLGALIVLPEPAASLAVAGLTIAALFFFSSAQGAGIIVILALVFALVATGCSVFGLLLGRSVRRLGDISYSLYLLHGIVLSAAFSIESVKQFALVSPERYWLVVGLCGIVLVALSTLTLVMVERPGIELGRALGRTIANRQRA